MKFIETNLKDVYVVELEEIADSRGFFARSFCGREFEKHGLKATVAQGNLSFNHKKGTMRGMHYSARPVTETKLVRCTAGAVYDCIVDVRPESPTYLQHFGIELTAQNRRALYVPEMFAHGYLTLTDGAEVVYQVGDFYQPGYERGVRYDDPKFGIKWPIAVEVISEKDTKWAPFQAE
ncbi:MAG: dTDP-4-dehydrorhamnose 3,5-epimerase [Myxococcaceae bacterium]|nr:dTDP-4-dehydrorhamnose 3,5-epimerase [Myxococcaceae bacterium]